MIKCFFDSFPEHCVSGPVWEAEDAGYGLLWASHAGQAQRNGATLRHEDPRQTEGRRKLNVEVYIYK